MTYVEPDLDEVALYTCPVPNCSWEHVTGWSDDDCRRANAAHVAHWTAEHSEADR